MRQISGTKMRDKYQGQGQIVQDKDKGQIS